MADLSAASPAPIDARTEPTGPAGPAGPAGMVDVDVVQYAPRPAPIDGMVLPMRRGTADTV